MYMNVRMFNIVNMSNVLLFFVWYDSSPLICRWLGIRRCGKQLATVWRGRSEAEGAATVVLNCQKKSVILQVMFQEHSLKQYMLPALGPFIWIYNVISCVFKFLFDLPIFDQISTSYWVSLSYPPRSSQGHTDSWDVPCSNMADKRRKGRARKLLETVCSQGHAGSSWATYGHSLP